MNIKNDLDELFILIQKDYFINAHDKCEDLWREYKNNLKTRDESFILKSFVNGIAFLELMKMQRDEHANKIWQIFKKYEKLIDEINSINKIEYKRLQKLIYEKRDEIKI